MHSGRTWETDASETGLVAEPTVFRVNQSSNLAAYLAARRANPPRCGRGEETDHFAEKACGIALSRSRRRRCAAQTGTADVTTPFPTRHFLWRSLARARARLLKTKPKRRCPPGARQLNFLVTCILIRSAASAPPLFVATPQLLVEACRCTMLYGGAQQ